MWFLLFRPTVLAHPFEAEFYGHQLDLELRPEILEAEYLLEIPMPRLADDVRGFLDGYEGPKDRKETTRLYLKHKYEEIVGQLRLQIDGEVVRWTEWEPLSEKLETEGRFVRVRLRLRASAPDGAHGISLVNTNHIEETGIFRSSLSIGDGILLDDSDLLAAEGREGRHDRWMREEELRELRLSYRTLPRFFVPALRGGRSQSRRGRPRRTPARRHSGPPPQTRRSRASAQRPLRSRASPVVPALGSPRAAAP